MHRERVEKWFLHTERQLLDLPWWRPEEVPEDLPRPVVLVNGCFDLFHYSHARLLWAAREKATPKGSVVVAMDSDDRVRTLKGKGQPILNWVERASMLAYMPITGVVEFNSEEELGLVIGRTRPDLRVAGGDRNTGRSRFPHTPKMFVTDTGLHTGMIIARVLDRLGH